MSEDSSTPSPVRPPAVGYTKDQTDKKLIAGLFGIFGIFFGGWGIHKFILGYNKEGVIQLLLCFVCGIGTIIGVVEGIIYLTKSDDEFVSTYLVGRKGWF